LANVRSENVNCAEILPRAYLHRDTIIYILSGKINTITEVCRYYTENLSVSFAYAAGWSGDTVREYIQLCETSHACVVRYAAELRSLKRDGDGIERQGRERRTWVSGWTAAEEGVLKKKINNLITKLHWTYRAFCI